MDDTTNACRQILESQAYIVTTDTRVLLLLLIGIAIGATLAAATVNYYWKGQNKRAQAKRDRGEWP